MNQLQVRVPVYVKGAQASMLRKACYLSLNSLNLRREN